MTRRPLAAQFWYALLWCFCWAVGKAWFRLGFTGRAHVPKIGPVLLASNHQSHLDPLFVGVGCPRQMSALARHSLFFWPLSWIIRSLGAVPIERGGAGFSGFKATLKLLRQGESLLVFPEGTRTYDGKLQAFLPGFCALARRSDATIVPVAIRGAFEAFPRGSFFARPGEVFVTYCQPLTPPQIAELSDEQIVELVYQRISAAMRPAKRGITA
jgi:1-acyl-sn-glycerol-3-phosphate acyltransferase